MRRNLFTFIAKLCIIAAIACLSASARAEPVMEAGLWCDTPEQAQQVARAENPQATVSEINAETKGSCGSSVVLADIMGVVADFWANGHHFQVVKVHVHGFVQNNAMMLGLDVDQYGLREATEVET